MPPCPFLQPTARGVRCVLLPPEGFRGLDPSRCRDGYHSCAHFARVALLPRERFRLEAP